MLIVEDDPDIQKIAKHVLASGGYDVATACNGEEALDYLRRGAEPTVILLDLMMPIMDGYEFRKQQREDPKLAPIPVIVCSGCTEVERRAATLGAAAYIDKPFAFPELLRLVDAHRLKG